MIGRTIRSQLIWRFTTAILIPAVITIVVGVRLIHQQVFNQAQAQVNSDLVGAQEILRNYQERLKDAVRIHATRMVIYRALDQGDMSGLEPEMERVRRGEGLDILTLTDVSGLTLYRTRNPSATGDDRTSDELVRRTLQSKVPQSGVVIVPAEELAVESPDLARQALMQITPTPMAGPSEKSQETAGMMFKAAAPVFSSGGRLLGVLYGGVLINRNYEAVDKIRQIVFRGEVYKGREVGTATIFQDDIRISTNVLNADGSRAITTRVSEEVAEQVLRGGRTWQGRAFVVNDWYISAYAPLKDFLGKTVGMLYVGTLERPFQDNLWKSLFIFLSITVLGVAIVTGVAIVVAQRISRPIHAMAEASEKVAEGDYQQRVDYVSPDEIGYLVGRFNHMIQELARANRELQEWASNLEAKVEERTAQVRAMQRQLIQTEKLAAIGKLAAGVAHEINNPLTGVLTSSSLLLEDTPPEDPRREDLKIIVDETMRCRKIVKGLLDFARQTKPQKQAVNFNVVITDVLNLVGKQAIFRDIVTQLDLAPDLPAVMADQDQMRQVVLNVVLNAAEAMPNGGEIRLSSHLDEKSRSVQVSIADNGSGIPEGIRDKLFEPFFTTKKTGTGLGLAIAYGIMERHGGTISIESRPGKGTTITFNMPVDSRIDNENPPEP